MNRFLVSIFLTCFASGFAYLGFDTIDYLTVEQFACLRREGFLNFIGRAYDPAGFVDETGIANLANAMQANLTVNAYMLPCASGNCLYNITDPADQVEEVANRLLGLGILHLRLFVGIQDNWSGVQDQDQQFIFDLVNAIGKVPGIERAGVMANQNVWFSVFGHFFSQISSSAPYLLWVYWNGRPDYNGYTGNNTFGGWTLYGHEYAGAVNTNHCAQNATLNYVYLQ